MIVEPSIALAYTPRRDNEPARSTKLGVGGLKVITGPEWAARLSDCEPREIGATEGWMASP